MYQAVLSKVAAVERLGEGPASIGKLRVSTAMRCEGIGVVGKLDLGDAVYIGGQEAVNMWGTC